MTTGSRAMSIFSIIAAIAIVLVVGCGGSSGTGSDAFIPEDGNGASGTVQVLLTDAPAADLQEVWVSIAEIQLVPADDGDIVTLDENVLLNLMGPIDLLTLRNTSLELGEADVPVGVYEQIRLVLNPAGNRIVLPDGTKHELTVPSGVESGVKVNVGEEGLEIIAGSTTTLLLDFMAAPSVHKAGQSGMWIMRPVINGMRPDGDDGPPEGGGTPDDGAEIAFGEIEGEVRDSNGDPLAEIDGKPIAVILEGATSRQMAHVNDEDGEFEIPSVLPGSYELSVGEVDQDGQLVGSPFPIIVDGEGQGAATVQVTVEADGEVELEITVETPIP